LELRQGLRIDALDGPVGLSRHSKNGRANEKKRK
jgi:hypothetical protein